MGLFDIKGPFDRGSNPITEFLEENLNQKIREEVRKKVDDVVSPQSDLGNVFHKVRKRIDKDKEKEKNRKNAPKNLLYIGKESKGFEVADHLFIRRGLYTHHAIYIGGNQVIHYSSIPDGI